MSVAKPFRAEDWWIGKASLLMGLVYLFTIYFQIPFADFGLWACCSLLTIIGFASLGYLVNDFFDLEKDKLANKKNFLLDKSAIQQTVYFSIALLLLFAPWYFLPYDFFTIALMLLQLLLYLLYSMPGIRLKERGISGLITDALYAHSIPSLMAAHTYALISNKPLGITFIVLLFAWQFCVGIRNILLHQLNDYNSDRISNTKTYILINKSNESTLLLQKLIVTELTILISIFIILLWGNKMFLIALVLILCSLLYNFLKHTQNHEVNYYPNSIYEHILPFAFISILATGDKRYVLILLLQFILFSGKKIGMFISCIPFKGFWFNIENKIGYSAHFAFSNLKLGINLGIYYFFRIIGIDLIKEKTDAKGYILRQLNKKK